MPDSFTLYDMPHGGAECNDKKLGGKIFAQLPPPLLSYSLPPLPYSSPPSTLVNTGIFPPASWIYPWCLPRHPYLSGEALRTSHIPAFIPAFQRRKSKKGDPPPSTPTTISPPCPPTPPPSPPDPPFPHASLPASLPAYASSLSPPSASSSSSSW